MKHARSRKSFLFHDNHTWAKRGSLNAFHVTMVNFDGAGIYEIFGLSILSKLYVIDFSRDDGVAVLIQNLAD